MSHFPKLHVDASFICGLSLGKWNRLSGQSRLMLLYRDLSPVPQGTEQAVQADQAGAQGSGPSGTNENKIQK